VTACHNSALQVRDDVPAVQALLSSGRPVVAVLSTEAAAGLYPMPLADAERILERYGFDAVETTALGEELVAAAYEQLHARAGATLPRLRSTCPVVVDWVLRFHPALSAMLVPVVPPYVAQSRLVKQVWPEGTGVAYVSPCWARKDDPSQAGFSDAVDVVIGFDELARMLAEAPARPTRDSSAVQHPRVRPAKRRALTDGYPRTTLTSHDLTTDEVVTVRGLEELDRLLIAVTQGETAPAVIDALMCEGCADGPAIPTSLSVFARRSVIAADERRRTSENVDAHELLSALPAIDLLRTFQPRPVLETLPTDGEIDAALSEAEMIRSDTIDCGACGYDTCVEQAAAVCLGNSTWELCFPLQRKRFDRESQLLEEAATLDPLTALANRRGLDARLAEEVARARRYSAQLSLIILDLDHFKDVNDRHGHRCGDSVLSLAAMVIRRIVRAADLAARFGGDEFVLLLPNTSKTEAFVVAEKIRVALAQTRMPASGGEELALTASLGVASLGGSDDAETLLKAADAALYRAKSGGRDRVEIAPG
jgi:diguanylate cyclase (GGDEF)-like protein